MFVHRPRTGFLAIANRSSSMSMTPVLGAEWAVPMLARHPGLQIHNTCGVNVTAPAYPCATDYLCYFIVQAHKEIIATTPPEPT